MTTTAPSATTATTVAAVVGSRTFGDYSLLCKTLDTHRSQFRAIVSGGAMGADSLAARYARENCIPLTELRPDWKAHGVGAYLVRNTDIVAGADYVIAFWNGKSPGTRDTIRKAVNAGKRVQIIPFTEEDKNKKKRKML